MKELSLFDKFGILFSNILEHPLFIVLLFVPIILFFLQKKHGKKVFIIVYFISIILVLVIGGDELFKLFDNFMDGLFMVLYFPNFITLFIVALLSAVFGFVSLFSSKMHKVNKIINYVFFGIVQSLFILVILTVRSSEINIYKDNALYSNNEVLSMMQIMIGAFGVQMLSLLVINLINKVTSILDKRDASLSKSIDEQISSLSRHKVKLVNVDNDKVGFINVADKKKSSTPILKPFKFDIDKLQSIKLNVFTKPKKFKSSTLKGDETSYLNEVVKQKDYKPSNLNGSETSYLNEVIKPKKYKFLRLDSNKFIFLNTPVNNEILSTAISNSGRNKTLKNYKIFEYDSNRYFNLNVENKLYNGIKLGSKDFSYLNEIIKKYKIFKLNSSKIMNLQVKDKKFKNVIVNFNTVSYLNEIKKNYNIIDLQSDKLQNVTLNVKEEKKPFRFASLKDKAVSYIHETLKKPLLKPFVIDTTENFEVKNDSKPKEEITLEPSKPLVKPDLLSPMKSNDDNNFVSVFESKPIYEETTNVIDEDMSIANLIIMDMQSMLDVAGKYHLMKFVNLEEYDDDDAVDKLKIPNFDLLLSTLKKYSLIKNNLFKK